MSLPWNSSTAYGCAAIDADDLAGDVGGRRHTQERPRMLSPPAPRSGAMEFSAKILTPRLPPGLPVFARYYIRLYFYFVF